MKYKWYAPTCKLSYMSNDYQNLGSARLCGKHKEERDIVVSLRKDPEGELS